MSKEVGEERGAQGGVDRRSDNATSVDSDVEIDPHCRRLKSRLPVPVFGECAFPPVSLGPAGDCPCKD